MASAGDPVGEKEARVRVIMSCPAATKSSASKARRAAILFLLGIVCDLVGDAVFHAKDVVIPTLLGEVTPVAHV